MSIKFPKGTSVNFIEEFIQNLDRFAYHEMVIQHLEYMGFPPYAEEFDAEHVARVLVWACDEGMKEKFSPRMVALTLFGTCLTALQEASSQVTKH